MKDNIEKIVNLFLNIDGGVPKNIIVCPNTKQIYVCNKRDINNKLIICNKKNTDDNNLSELFINGLDFTKKFVILTKFTYPLDKFIYKLNYLLKDKDLRNLLIETLEKELYTYDVD